MDVSYFILPSFYQRIFNLFPFFIITNNVINHFIHVQVYHQGKFIEVKFLSHRMCHFTFYILIGHYRWMSLCRQFDNIHSHTTWARTHENNSFLASLPVLRTSKNQFSIFEKIRKYYLFYMVCSHGNIDLT